MTTVMEGLDLRPLALAVAGGILVWTGIYDPAGGPVGALRDLASGRKPTPGQQKKSVVGSIVNKVTDAAVASLGATGENRIGGSENTLGSDGARVASVALSYKGAPYQWGGTTKRGIDCSGLVLVAYRDGAGITLLHDATSQTRRGKKIPRGDVRAGDLVAWGTPARYPHIALAINNSECMGAWATGTPAGVKRIDIRMYGGFPTCFRILGA